MESTQLPITVVHWLLALVPILVLLILLVVVRWQGMEAGPVGMFAAAIVALLFFQTPGEALAVAGAAGVWDAVFILYVIWPALLLYIITVRAGAFDALRHGFIEFSQNEMFLVLAVGWVFSSFFQSISGFGTPIAVVAPLLLGLGVRPIYAVVIPLIGHAWANMFGTLAVGWLATLQVIDLSDPTSTAIQSAILLWIPNLLGGLTIAWMYGRIAAVRQALPMILIISAIHGGVQLGFMFINPILSTFFAGTIGLVALYPLSHWKRYKEPAEGIDERPAMRDPEEGDGEGQRDAGSTAEAEPDIGIGLALLPYIVLTAAAILALAVPPVEEALSQFEIGFPMGAVETGYGVTQEAEEPYSPFAPFTHPGTFLLIAAGVSYAVYRAKGYIGPGSPRAEAAEEGQSLWARLAKDAIPSSLAITAFLVMSKLMDYSGQTSVLAQGIAAVSGATVFAFVSNLIGILGAFMTSSNTASNVLFAPLQQDAVAALEGLSEPTIIAAQSTGGAIGNAIAPANIVLGTGTTGIVGQEGVILRKTLPWAGLLAVITGVATVLLNNWF